MNGLTIAHQVKQDGGPKLDRSTQQAAFLLGLSLFFLMLFVPTVYQPIKAIVLVALLYVILIGILTNQTKFALHYSVVVWACVLIGTGLFFIFWGVVNNAPGALRVATVYVLWPLVFTFLIAAISSAHAFQAIFTTIIVASFAIGVYSLTFIGYATGLLPSWMYFELDQGQAIGLHGGFVEYNMYSISTLIFVVPFMFALLHGFVFNQKSLFWLLCLAFVLCLILAILSGRRVLWLVLILTPIIYGLLSIIKIKRERIKLRFNVAWLVLLPILTIVLTFVFGTFELDLYAIIKQIVAAFGGGSGPIEASAYLRFEQAAALHDGWMQSPLLGHGHGAVAGVIRSYEMPWAYELQYHALFFNTGIVGALLYAGCIVWIYWQGVRMIRSSVEYGRLMLPLLVGLTCFLIANATNPYLLKFDYMWVIFLPLAIINRFLIEFNPRRSKQ